MATFRLKDAGAAGRKSGGVRMQSMHTIDPIACSDSVRRTDAHVRPSTRWETEDVGGSSWAPLRSPNRSPRLSIHRPASVREDLRPLATGGHVPRLSPRMRRLYRYTMCTRSPKPRASPCRSCCLWRLEVSFSTTLSGPETRRCDIASVTIVSAGSRERVSMVSPKTARSPRFRIAEARSVEWFSKTCVVRMLASRRRRSDGRVRSRARQSKVIRCCYSMNCTLSGFRPGTVHFKVVGTVCVLDARSMAVSSGFSPWMVHPVMPRAVGSMIATWLILPVVICLSQRLSHACLSINCFIL